MTPVRLLLLILSSIVTLLVLMLGILLVARPVTATWFGLAPGDARSLGLLIIFGALLTKFTLTMLAAWVSLKKPRPPQP